MSDFNSRVYRERDVAALWRLAVLLMCGLALAAGFVFAARQRFVAVQVGYQIEDLRREQQQLLEQRRRLELMKEQISSPARLEVAARRIGMQSARVNQIAGHSEATTTAPTTAATQATMTARSAPASAR